MRIKSILLTTAVGTGICFILSLLFFGVRFSDVSSPPIYLLFLGFAGSLSLGLFREGQTREVIYLNLLVYLLFVITTLRFRPVMALIFLLYDAALIFGIYIFFRKFDKEALSQFLTGSLLLAAIAGLMYIAASLIHGLFFISKFQMGFLLKNFPIGFLAGLGIGLGDAINRRYWQASEE